MNVQTTVTGFNTERNLKTDSLASSGVVKSIFSMTSQQIYGWYPQEVQLTCISFQAICFLPNISFSTAESCCCCWYWVNTEVLSVTVMSLKHITSCDIPWMNRGLFNGFASFCPSLWPNCGSLVFNVDPWITTAWCWCFRYQRQCHGVMSSSFKQQ